MAINYNTKFIPYLKLIFERIYCPKCDRQMKKFMSPWMLGWKCPSCKSITWYDTDKWGPLFDNFTKTGDDQKNRNVYTSSRKGLKDYRGYILTAFVSLWLGLLLSVILL